MDVCLHYPCNFRLAFWLQFEFLTCLCYLLYCVLFPLLRQRERERKRKRIVGVQRQLICHLTKLVSQLVGVQMDGGAPPGLQQESELSAQSIFDCMVILVNAGLCICPTKKGLTCAYMEYFSRGGQSSDARPQKKLKALKKLIQIYHLECFLPSHIAVSL